MIEKFKIIFGTAEGKKNGDGDSSTNKFHFTPKQKEETGENSERSPTGSGLQNIETQNKEADRESSNRDNLAVIPSHQVAKY
ncbi:hypothetical protein WA026_013007 [Henosepilachna vigintioctopunctata]|uniref:Uncharacterized protein n=1 Tax=Henosepilachna vigintioctopunctata TaxID=420089 RepID=A0AAW1TU10_9CUCU